jgi:hypothetical protein
MEGGNVHVAMGLGNAALGRDRDLSSKKGHSYAWELNHLINCLKN